MLTFKFITMKSLKFIIIYVILLIFPVYNSFSQVIESEKSTIHINNKKQVAEILVDSVPPIISLISPQVRGSETFNTNYEKLILIGKVTDENGISTLLINSKEVIPSPEGIFREEINLKKGENNFKIIALDRDKNLAEKSISINYSSSDYASDTFYLKGKYYALLIAVNEYNNPEVHNLQNPVQDAEALYKVLSSKYLFNNEDILFLKNPTREDIILSLDELSSKITNNDNLLVFYAGHGYWDNKDESLQLSYFVY